jgi:multiple sugar transport system permease protein
MKRALLYVLLTVGALAFLYPFAWMIAASFKPENEIAGFGLTASRWTFENYLFVFRKISLGRAFLNSVFVSLVVTTSVIFFGMLTGYALARLEFKGRAVLHNVLLLTMMIPAQLTLIPLYTLVVRFGWINSFWALIVPAMMSSYAALLFRSFFLTLPTSLLEAARLDGCNDWRILTSIVLPLSKPVVWTVGVLTFMGIWNDVLWSLMVIRDEARMTMPLAVTLFATGGGAEARLGAQLAAATVLAIPVIIAYILLQRRLIESMAATGMKN